MKVHSFEELAAIFEVKKKEPKEPKEIKCRVCGAPMQAIPGSNVMHCTGTVTKTDRDGNSYETPCNNYFLTKRAR